MSRPKSCPVTWKYEGLKADTFLYVRDHACRRTFPGHTKHICWCGEAKAEVATPALESYEAIIARAKIDTSYREGLLAAAHVALAQGTVADPCPSDMAAVYITRLTKGQMP